jgi:hypothetical protein
LVRPMPTCNDHRMRIVGAFIADSVERTPNGLLNVRGGYPEVWNVPGLPSVQDIGLALVLEVEPREIDHKFVLIAEIKRTRDDKQLIAVEITFVRGSYSDVVTGGALYHHIVANLHLEFLEAGRHEISIRGDDGVEALIRFGVRVRPRSFEPTVATEPLL